MAFESLDDAMLWHGSLIGYMAGVKSVCKDEDKSSLLLRMADTQAKLEFIESENAKLREENSMLRKYTSKALSAISYCCDCCPYVDCGCDTETVPMHEGCKAFEELREMGVEVDE